MRTETIAKLNFDSQSSPILWAKGVPDQVEIKEAQSTLGCTFHPDYIDFLERYGAGMVGSLPVFGLRPVEMMGDNSWSVVEMTQEYRSQDWPDIDEWYVISEDGYGNPIGVNKEGKVLSYNHDYQKMHEWAENFETFILKQMKHC